MKMNWLFKHRMYKKYREFILCIMDVALVILSFFLSIILKFDFTFPSFISTNWLNTMFLLLSIVVIYVACFLIFRIHQSLWKYVGPQEVIRLCIAIASATMILSVCYFTIYGVSKEMMSILILTALLSIIMMLILRLGYRLLRRASISENKLKQVLIIGAGDAGYLLSKELSQNKSLSVHVVGYLDDYKVGRVIEGHKVLGRIDALAAIVEKYHVEEVYVAMPSGSKTLHHNILETCVALNMKVKIMKKVEERFYGDDEKSLPIQDVSIEDLLGRGEIHLEQNEIVSYLGNNTILVTGAGGSIGSELCRQIIRFKPKRLVMLDINENGLYMLEQEFNRMRRHGTLDEKIEIISYVASIRDKKALQSIFQDEKPQVVYHAAAHKHVPLMETRPTEAIKNNVFGTKNVIDTCLQTKVRRFIMISTDKAVNPTNVMGATKRMTEMILQAYGDNGTTKMAAVRFGNVLGSNGSVIPIFKNQIAEGGPLTITDKKIERYFMTIPEAAQLVLQTGFYADHGEIFVLDMGKPVKIIDLALKLIRLSGLEPNKDIEIKEIGLRPGEKMFEELSLSNEKHQRTKNDLIFKIERMPISTKKLDEKLNILYSLLDDKTSNVTLKGSLMDVIKDVEVVGDANEG